MPSHGLGILPYLLRTLGTAQHTASFQVIQNKADGNCADGSAVFFCDSFQRFHDLQVFEQLVSVEVGICTAGAAVVAAKMDCLVILAGQDPLTEAAPGEGSDSKLPMEFQNRLLLFPAGKAVLVLNGCEILPVSHQLRDILCADVGQAEPADLAFLLQRQQRI